MIHWKVTPSELALLDELCARHDVDRSALLRKALFLIAEQPLLLQRGTARVVIS